MKRIVAAALVFFGGAAAWADMPSGNSDVTSEAKSRTPPPPLRAYNWKKVDPLNPGATMDSQGLQSTPYLAGSTGRYGNPQGPMSPDTLSGQYRPTTTEYEVASKPTHWGEKKSKSDAPKKHGRTVRKH